MEEESIQLKERINGCIERENYSSAALFATRMIQFSKNEKGSSISFSHLDFVELIKSHFASSFVFIFFVQKKQKKKKIPICWPEFIISISNTKDRLIYWNHVIC